jgi:hypothetical protein
MSRVGSFGRRPTVTESSTITTPSTQEIAPARPKGKGLVLGFFTLSQDGPSGWVAGYLLTNVQGRPLEFRLTSPVQPTKVQQILYGPTLDSYLVGELMGKNLIEKASFPADIVLTDLPMGLEVRRHSEVPLLLLGDSGRPIDLGARKGFSIHPEFVQDEIVIQQLVEGAGQRLDLSEPFTRIREAITETRRMGMGNRSVA